MAVMASPISSCRSAAVVMVFAPPAMARAARPAKVPAASQSASVGTSTLAGSMWDIAPSIAATTRAVPEWPGSSRPTSQDSSARVGAATHASVSEASNTRGSGGLRCVSALMNT
jgi:hypothetical protein